MVVQDKPQEVSPQISSQPPPPAGQETPDNAQKMGRAKFWEAWSWREYALAAFVVLVVLIGAYGLFVFLTEPTQVPESVNITNMVDRSFTISWMTREKATKGYVIVSEKDSFTPVVSRVFGDKRRDERDNLVDKWYDVLGTNRRYYTHIVHVENLKPETQYFVRIGSGNRLYGEDKDEASDWASVWTLKTLEENVTPDPAYGRVMTEDGKSPAPGALVFMQLRKKDGDESGVLSCLTKENGTWVIDKGNARTGDRIKSFGTLGSDDEEIMWVDTEWRGQAKEVKISPDNDQPAPNITLTGDLLSEYVGKENEPWNRFIGGLTSGIRGIGNVRMGKYVNMEMVAFGLLVILGGALLLNRKRLKYLAVLVALGEMMSGGVEVFAQGSLPEDIEVVVYEFNIDETDEVEPPAETPEQQAFYPEEDFGVDEYRDAYGAVHDNEEPTFDEYVTWLEEAKRWDMNDPGLLAMARRAWSGEGDEGGGEESSGTVITNEYTNEYTVDIMGAIVGESEAQVVTEVIDPQKCFNPDGTLNEDMLEELVAQMDPEQKRKIVEEALGIPEEERKRISDEELWRRWAAEWENVKNSVPTEFGPVDPLAAEVIKGLQVDMARREQGDANGTLPISEAADELVPGSSLLVAQEGERGLGSLPDAEDNMKEILQAQGFSVEVSETAAFFAPLIAATETGAGNPFDYRTAAFFKALEDPEQCGDECRAILAQVWDPESANFGFFQQAGDRYNFSAELIEDMKSGNLTTEQIELILEAELEQLGTFVEKVKPAWSEGWLGSRSETQISEMDPEALAYMKNVIASGDNLFSSVEQCLKENCPQSEAAIRAAGYIYNANFGPISGDDPRSVADLWGDRANEAWRGSLELAAVALAGEANEPGQIDLEAVIKDAAVVIGNSEKGTLGVEPPRQGGGEIAGVTNDETLQVIAQQVKSQVDKAYLQQDKYISLEDYKIAWYREMLKRIGSREDLKEELRFFPLWLGWEVESIDEDSSVGSTGEEGVVRFPFASCKTSFELNVRTKLPNFSLTTVPSVENVCSGDTVYVAVSSNQTGKQASASRLASPVYAQELEENLHPKGVTATPNGVTVALFDDENGNNQKDEGEEFLNWAGVEIELHETSRNVDYDLQTGWNLISVPVSPGEGYNASTVITEIARQDGYATAVSTYQSGKWITYKQRGDTVFSDENFPIVPGRGYWIRVHKPLKFEIAGKLPAEPTALSLDYGWNLVGVHPGYSEDGGQKIWNHAEGDNGWTAVEVMDSARGEGVEADTVTEYRSGRYVSVIKDEDNAGQLLVYGTDYSVDEKKGYFIRVKGEGKEWNP